MKKKLILIMALALVISTGTMALAQANDYQNNWAKDEITYMMEKGVVVGYPDNTFRPQNNMLKSEFFRVINQLMGYTEKDEVEFSDVKPSDWYYEEVAKGLEAGYIMEGDILNAGININRGEVARIISIVMDVEADKEAAETFKDSEEFSEDMKGVLGGLKEKGYISGRPDGTFDTQANITRAEAMRVLYNISQDMEDEDDHADKVKENNIIVKHRAELLKLEEESRDSLEDLLEDAKEDLDAAGNNESAVQAVYEEYLGKAEKLEEETSMKLEEKIADAEAELKENGFTTDRADELRQEYEREKARQEEIIKAQFDNDLKRMLSEFFSN